MLRKTAGGFRLSGGARAGPNLSGGALAGPIRAHMGLYGLVIGPARAPPERRNPPEKKVFFVNMHS